MREPKSAKVTAALEKVPASVTAESVEDVSKFGQVVFISNSHPPPHPINYFGVDSYMCFQVILFAVPFGQLETAIKGAGDITNKIVIDATNPVVFKDGKLSLTIGTTTSAGIPLLHPLSLLLLFFV